MKEEIKPRKPAGPKIKIANRRLVNVSLGGIHEEKARRMGKGNLSAGLRLAVEAYQEEGNDKPE